MCTVVARMLYGKVAIDYKNSIPLVFTLVQPTLLCFVADTNNNDSGIENGEVEGMVPLWLFFPDMSCFNIWHVQYVINTLHSTAHLPEVSCAY